LEPYLLSKGALGVGFEHCNHPRV